MYQNYKLGCKPQHDHDPRILSLNHYRTNLPSPPNAKDYTKPVSNWGMMLNDNIGDCTCAAVGHIQLGLSSNASSPFRPTDMQVQQAYIDVTGEEGAAYNPKTGNNDNGCVVTDVLEYWRTVGVGGRKIDAWAAIELKNHTAIKEAINIFGHVYLGVELPLSAQNQVGKTWTVTSTRGSGKPGSWGGHAIPVFEYGPGQLAAVTWGALQLMTWAWLDEYCSEIYAVIDEEWIKSTGKSVSGYNLTTLKNDLSALGQVHSTKTVNLINKS